MFTSNRMQCNMCVPPDASLTRADAALPEDLESEVASAPAQSGKVGKEERYQADNEEAAAAAELPGILSCRHRRNILDCLL